MYVVTECNKCKYRLYAGRLGKNTLPYRMISRIVNTPCPYCENDTPNHWNIVGIAETLQHEKMSVEEQKCIAERIFIFLVDQKTERYAVTTSWEDAIEHKPMQSLTDTLGQYKLKDIYTTHRDAEQLVGDIAIESAYYVTKDSRMQFVEPE